MNLWRPVAAFIGALVLLAAVLSGGYQQAADWAGKRFAEVIVPDVPTEPGPTKPAKQQKKQKQQG